MFLVLFLCRFQGTPNHQREDTHLWVHMFVPLSLRRPELWSYSLRAPKIHFARLAREKNPAVVHTSPQNG